MQGVAHAEGLLPKEASKKLSPLGQLVYIKGIIDAVSPLDIQPKRARKLLLKFQSRPQLPSSDFVTVSTFRKRIHAIGLPFQFQDYAFSLVPFCKSNKKGFAEITHDN